MASIIIFIIILVSAFVSVYIEEIKSKRELNCRKVNKKYKKIRYIIKRAVEFVVVTLIIIIVGFLCGVKDDEEKERPYKHNIGHGGNFKKTKSKLKKPGKIKKFKLKLK